MNPEHLQKLVTTVMPYGKYKGRLIADLPGNYLNWFAREGFPPGERWPLAGAHAGTGSQRTILATHPSAEVIDFIVLTEGAIVAESPFL